MCRDAELMMSTADLRAAFFAVDIVRKAVFAEWRRLSSIVLDVCLLE